MQRRVEVTVPPEQTDELLARIQGMQGVLGLRVQRGISLQPKGDLLSVEALTATHLDVMDLLEDRGIGRDAACSITITETSAVVSPTVKQSLEGETARSSWEQMQAIVAKESNMTPYALTLMGISGVIAAIGLISGAIHVVIAAMVIAPGFEPVVRVPLGWAVQTRAWWRGLKHTLQGYLALMIGAALAALVVQESAEPLTSGPSAYFAVEPLMAYWTTVSLPSMVVAVVGGVAGAILIATGRSVLTSGVMIALALIPSAAMVGVSLVAGDMDLLLRALGRWALEVGVVLVSSGLFWILYRTRVQRRRSML